MSQGTSWVSLLPEDFASGLPDDFDGEILGACFVPYNYEGKKDNKGKVYDWVVAARFDIQPHDGQKPFPLYLKAADIDSFAPSADGITPVNLQAATIEEMMGAFLVKRPEGTKSKPSGQKFAFFMDALFKAGFPRDVFAQTGRLDSVVGLKAHFNRMAQEIKRGKKAASVLGEEQDEQRNDAGTLVVTQILELPKAGGVKVGVGAGAGAPKAAPVAQVTQAVPAAASGGDLESRVALALGNAAKAAGGTITVGEITTALVGGFSGSERAQAIVLVRDGGDNFLNSHPEAFVYDAASKSLISTL